MPRASFRLSSRTRILRALGLLLGLILLIDTLSLLTTYHRLTSTPPPPPPLPTDQRIFIASIHWNNAAILNAHWSAALLELVTQLGPQNVYVSIYESGSWDDTKDALRRLDAELEKLGVARTVTLDTTTHAEHIANAPLPDSPPSPGWITTTSTTTSSSGKQEKKKKNELRRIPYLAGLRNRSLSPLLNDITSTPKFDKLLFLNDVTFTPSLISLLLSTRDGDYAAACSLDFSHPPHYYDTFALRDFTFLPTTSSTFPYFGNRESRRAMLRGEPVPVRSCWNGVVVFDAAPFYAEGGGLGFRGVEDGLAERHVEGSECCLVHVDNPLSGTRGVWVNPRVRVGYSVEAGEEVRGERWLGGVGGVVGGVWRERLGRLAGGWKGWRDQRKVRGRVEGWKREGIALGEERREEGVGCLIDEMQVLRENGWAHV